MKSEITANQAISYDHMMTVRIMNYDEQIQWNKNNHSYSSYMYITVYKNMNKQGYDRYQES